MFGISGSELLIIVAFGFFIFGPDKLPQVARTISRMMTEFRRAQDTMEATIRAELWESGRADAPIIESGPEVPTVTDESDDEEDEE
ncbi:MAG: twin-arginine translocase TatA/TatE family subunit [Coriobacteriia bacterium]